MTLAFSQSILREAIVKAASAGGCILLNARLHSAVANPVVASPSGDGFFLADIAVKEGRILSITPPGLPLPEDHGDLIAVDVGGKVILPTFVDCHTHLDKGHILPRTTEADGSFDGALAATRADRTSNWSADDVARRMDFALRSAFHYGTAAIRTHLDSQPPQDDISWPVFEELREEWRGRIELQASCLFPIEMARDDAFLEKLVARVAAANGIVGAVLYPVPDLDGVLDRIFRMAERHALNLDFHADETADPSANALRRVADTVLRTKFAGRALVGHCCSLALQDAATVDATLDRVAEAGIAVVSLPTCNLYLQDRRHDGTTPRWRGVTLLHEMKRRGIPVALASDNTRDPFHAYGDLDMLDTYRLATRVLQLDHPVDDWPAAISVTPAKIMDMRERGPLAQGRAADFILFNGRSFSELLSRAQSDRIVIRAGMPISAPLPCYAELDDLKGMST
jgi:cytosine deaminase